MKYLTHRWEAQQLLQVAAQYERMGDIYHAVKLYKKICRLLPDWSVAYFQLSLIYRARLEWKPAFHYSQRTLEGNPDNEIAQWNLGLAATVLQRWDIAGATWKYLKHHKSKYRLLPIQLQNRGFQEIVWASPIDPVRAKIESIPHPFSKRQYGEVILHDRKSMGKLVVQQQSVSIYPEIQLLERSFFETYSVLLHTDKASDINLLDQLCLDSDIGFDNWSNTNEIHTNKQRKASPEYYTKDFFEGTQDSSEQNYAVIGMAAKRKDTILEILENWRIISLADYSQLERH